MLPKELIESIKKNEGFSGLAYNDTLGYPTIGYGTKLPITNEEAFFLLKYRLERDIKCLRDKWGAFEALPDFAKLVVCEMVYQLGVNGFLNFKKTIKHLEAGQWGDAKQEALKSKWATQTPKRAQKVLERLNG